MSLAKALPLLRPRPQCFTKLPSLRTYANYPWGPNFSNPQPSSNAERPPIRPSYDGPIQRDPRLYTPPTTPNTLSEPTRSVQRPGQSNISRSEAEENDEWPENYQIPTS